MRNRLLPDYSLDPRLDHWPRSLSGLAGDMPCMDRYYTGRLLTYDEKYQEADAHLSYAFTNCDPQAHGNKRRILRYLIPVSASFFTPRHESSHDTLPSANAAGQ